MSLGKTISKELRFKLHSEKQQDAVFSDSPITLASTGIQWGKTTTGALWLKRYTHRYTDKLDAFIICSPTYKILNQSTLPPFLNIMSDYGVFNKAEYVFRLYNGGTIYMRTNTDPDSIVGITNVRAIWGDEAGKYTLYFWENIQGRSSFKEAPIMLTTSPYSMNWIFKQVIKPSKEGKRPDIKLIQARSEENPYFPRAEYERKKATMDPRRFNMMYGGMYDKMEGLVYDCFDEAYNVCDPFPLPTGTRYFAGIDWGYTEPFCLVVRAITPNGNHYQVSEFYKSQITITDIIELCKQKKQIFDIEVFYCGHERPGDIVELNRAGCTAIATTQEKGTKRLGLDLHYELIRSRRYQIFKGAGDHTMDEMSAYHYPEPGDLGPDENAKENMPVEQNDHAMDANRFCTVMTYRKHEKKAPVITQEVTNRKLHRIEVIQRLKKGRLNNQQTEKWS